jgi:SAM-dependent methyltransferase
MTYALKKSGYDVIGLDISSKAVSNAVENYGEYYICQNVFDYGNSVGPVYDIIILSEVIEHVENPIGFIYALKNLLKINGKIIITTPNKNIYDSKIEWQTELPPVHCWWFSEKSIIEISRRLGAKIRFIDYCQFNNKYFRYLNMDSINKVSSNKSILDKYGNILSKNNNQYRSIGVKKEYYLINIVKYYISKILKRRVKLLNDQSYTLCAILEWI